MEEKKSNSSLIVLVCLIVAVAICCGFLIVKQLNKNITPKNMFINGVESLFKAEKNVEDFDSINSEVTLSLDAKSPYIEKDVLDLVSKITLKGKVAADIKDNIALIGLNAKYDKDDLVDFKLYSKENVAYMYLTDLFSKWIKFDIEDSTIINFKANDSDITMDEAKALISGVKEALLAALKDSYFTKEKEDSLTKVTLVINKDNILNIVEDTLTNLKENDDVKDVFKKVSGSDIDTVLDQVIEKIKNTDNETLSNLEDIKLAIYLNNKKEVKKVTIDTTVGEQPIKVEVTITSKNDVTVDLYMSGVKFLSISIKETTNKNVTNTTIGVSVSGMLDLTLNIESKIKYNEKIEAVDVSNNVEFNELTENDINNIQTKLMNNKAIQKLMTAVSNFMPQDELSDEDYDY